MEIPKKAGQGSSPRLETLAIHAGQGPLADSGAVAPPIVLSTTFARNEAGEFGAYIYSRSNNPNREAVEQKLAALEGGKEALAFSSGMAATMAVFQAILAPGAHLILPDDCYHGTRSLLYRLFHQWSVEHTEVDMGDLAQVEAAIRPNTRLLWIETPSNPKLNIADIAGVAALGARHGIAVVCDNTWATPFFQRPLELGVDLVMHSGTKYLGGHSDILFGCVVLGDQPELALRLRHIQESGGAVPSPFDCWLLYRSMATFPVRMPVHARNAEAIAGFLNGHPKIERVYYPGLSSHPNHEVAARQMKGGFGGMLSIEVRGGRAEAMALAGRLRLFQHATSLGGVESLIEHRLSAEGAFPKSPDNLLRVSVGIEHIDDLLEDLEQALR